MSAGEKVTAYDVVTERVVTMLEQGVCPWRRPWNAAHGANGGCANLISGRPYHGINALLLPAMGFDSPWWLTFNQARALGGCVRKGEKAFPVVFWKFLRGRGEDDAPDAQPRMIPFLRYFSCFNLAQVDGIAPEALPKHARPDTEREAPAVREPIAECERVIARYLGNGGPAFDERERDQAGYFPMRDTVEMPARGQFGTLEAFYSTAFHELTHSTGHGSRLDRSIRNRFGSEPYGREELVAEMGAAFLAHECGIAPATITGSASYLGSWIRTLKTDPRAVVVAAGAAQKAVEMIAGRSKAEATDESEAA